MDEKDAIELRLAALERKMWMLLLHHAERRDLPHVREMLELIEAVDRI